MKTILVGVDFSEPGNQTIAEALRIAALTHARVVVLSVVEPPAVDRGDLRDGTFAELGLLAVEDVQRRLNKLRDDLARSGTKIETRYRVGPPGPCIVDTAATIGSDFIVLGSDGGHGALYEVMVGSTASYVLKHASAAVLVVPSRMNATSVTGAPVCGTTPTPP
jgi:nucleotide-binding universal stress UspA family protein